MFYSQKASGRSSIYKTLGVSHIPRNPLEIDIFWKCSIHTLPLEGILYPKVIWFRKWQVVLSKRTQGGLFWSKTFFDDFWEVFYPLYMTCGKSSVAKRRLHLWSQDFFFGRSILNIFRRAFFNGQICVIFLEEYNFFRTN